MLTKEVLDGIIRRRFNEGLTLSIEKVDGEEYSKWQLHEKSKKIYGGWGEALIANDIHPNQRNKVTKQDVVNELKKLQKDGHTMRTAEFEKWLYQGISKHFGGWKNACKELGIPQYKKNYSSDKRQVVYANKVVWDDSRFRRELSESIAQKLSRDEIRRSNPKLYSAILRKFGSLDICGEFFGLEIPDKISQQVQKRKTCEIKPGKFRRAFNTKEDVATAYKADIENGIKRGDITFRKAINKFFGSVDNLEDYLGMSNDSVPEDVEIYGKELLNEKVLAIYNKETEPISSKVLDDYDRNIVKSIRHHYKTINKYFSQLDIDFYAKPYVPFRWDAENTKRQLMRWIREGKPVNYTAIISKHTGIIEASRKLYGNYEGLFQACGLNYDDYRTDTNIASFYGRALEDIFEHILIDLEIEHVRQPEINGCHPDFVSGITWYDAKLSEWTINFSDCTTVRKYEPHCDSLIIVFLRGNKGTDKQLTEKTRLVNIYKYVDMLPSAKRSKYINALEEIESNVNSNELGSQTNDLTA